MTSSCHDSVQRQLLLALVLRNSRRFECLKEGWNLEERTGLHRCESLNYSMCLKNTKYSNFATGTVSYHFAISRPQRQLQDVHHAHCAGRVHANDHIANIGQAAQRVDVGLVGMCGERICEEDQTAKVPNAHEGGNLRVPAEGSRGAGQPILNILIVFVIFPGAKQPHAETAVETTEKKHSYGGERFYLAPTDSPSPQSSLHMLMVVWVPVMRNFLRISEKVRMKSFLCSKKDEPRSLCMKPQSYFGLGNGLGCRRGN